MAIARAASRVDSPNLGPAPGFFLALDAMSNRLNSILLQFCEVERQSRWNPSDLVALSAREAHLQYVSEEWEAFELAFDGYIGGFSLKNVCPTTVAMVAGDCEAQYLQWTSQQPASTPWESEPSPPGEDWPAPPASPPAVPAPASAPSGPPGYSPVSASPAPAVPAASAAPAPLFSSVPGPAPAGWPEAEGPGSPGFRSAPAPRASVPRPGAVSAPRTRVLVSYSYDGSDDTAALLATGDGLEVDETTGARRILRYEEPSFDSFAVAPAQCSSTGGVGDDDEDVVEVFPGN